MTKKERAEWDAWLFAEWQRTHREVTSHVDQPPPNRAERRRLERIALEGVKLAVARQEAKDAEKARRDLWEQIRDAMPPVPSDIHIPEVCALCGEIVSPKHDHEGEEE